MCDLLINAEKDRATYGFRSHRANGFVAPGVGHDTFIAAHRGLQTLGLIEVAKGFQQKVVFSGKASYHHGQATRARGTDALFRQSEAKGISPENWREHFQVVPSNPEAGVMFPLQCREGSRVIHGFKIKGRSIPIDLEGPVEAALHTQVVKLNTFLSNHLIEGLGHRGFSRVFSQGGRDEYRWNKGGRLYSLGANSYQSANAEERSAMTIDGEAVVEIDVKACHLTILRALKGDRTSILVDPYIIEGLPRPVVKAWVTMTLGHSRYHLKWSSKVRESLPEDIGAALGKTYPIAATKELIIDAIPVLKDWPRSEFRWGDFHFIESCVVIKAMETLAYSHGVPCLPVHDSIIVPASKAHLAEGILKQSFMDEVGVYPLLKTSGLPITSSP